MSGTFCKEQRLRTKGDFLSLKEGARRDYAGCLVAYSKKSVVDTKLTRIGFVVSKKLGNACVRNRFKRLLREKFRISLWKSMGIDVVVVVSPLLRKNFSKMPEREMAIVVDFDRLFARLRS